MKIQFSFGDEIRFVEDQPSQKVERPRPSVLNNGSQIENFVTEESVKTLIPETQLLSRATKRKHWQ